MPRLKKSTSLSTTATFPDNSQIQVDIHVCLLDAMTDNFPIKRSDIDANTVPSKPPIGAVPKGWGICLASFGDYIRRYREIYAFYVHKPLYTEETIDKKFPDIVLYLKKKIIAQYSGKE
jgi:hypothetical protein